MVGFSSAVDGIVFVPQIDVYIYIYTWRLGMRFSDIKVFSYIKMSHPGLDESEI